MTEVGDGAEASDREAVRAAPRWEAYALALGRVVNAMRWPEAAAAEWLRQQALAERVRVRFAPAWQYQHPTNRHREALLPVYEARGAYGPGISYCVWYWPRDTFTNLGPPAMDSKQTKFTEWNIGDLDAALDQLRTAADGGARHTGGRKPDWPWPEVVAEVAVAFALDGGRDGAEVVTATVRDAAERMTGRRPSRARAQTYAGIIRAAWERRTEDAKK